MAFWRVPRILLMEDDEALRGLLARVLRSAGYDVVEAADGASGLAHWREGGADLVLTDIHMPDTNGIEVMLELRTFAPALPVIAMSAAIARSTSTYWVMPACWAR